LAMPGRSMNGFLPAVMVLSTELQAKF
jgi:hypothetical protein